MNNRGAYRTNPNHIDKGGAIVSLSSVFFPPNLSGFFLSFPALNLGFPHAMHVVFSRVVYFSTCLQIRKVVILHLKILSRANFQHSRE